MSGKEIVVGVSASRTECHASRTSLRFYGLIDRGFQHFAGQFRVCVALGVELLVNIYP